MVLDFDKVLNSLQGVAGFLCLHQEKADQQLPSLLIRKGYSKGPDGILLHFLRAWVPNSETVSLRAALFPCEDHVESMSRQRCSWLAWCTGVWPWLLSPVLILTLTCNPGLTSDLPCNYGLLWWSGILMDPKSTLLDLLQYCDIVPWPAAQAIPLRSRLPISLGAASCCCSLTPISLCFLGCFCRGTSKNILQEVCVSSAAAYQLVCTGFPGPTHWRHESIQASSG